MYLRVVRYHCTSNDHGRALLPTSVRRVAVHSTSCHSNRVHWIRPRTMIGGDLHWAFGLYEVYQEVDYARPSLTFISAKGG